MSTFHHLHQQLKTLKLSGMLDAIETRVAQAEDGHLGYFDFLELLLEDEIARRARNSLSARIGRAHFDEVKTFEMFDFHADPTLPGQQIRDLATCRFLEAHACVLICGPVGVGPYCSLDSSLLNQSKSGAIYPNAQASALAIGDINGLQSSRLDPMENGLAGDLQGCCRLI